MHRLARSWLRTASEWLHSVASCVRLSVSLVTFNFFSTKACSPKRKDTNFFFFTYFYDLQQFLKVSLWNSQKFKLLKTASYNIQGYPRRYLYPVTRYTIKITKILGWNQPFPAFQRYLIKTESKHVLRLIVTVVLPSSLALNRCVA